MVSVSNVNDVRSMTRFGIIYIIDYIRKEVSDGYPIKDNGTSEISTPVTSCL